MTLSFLRCVVLNSKVNGRSVRSFACPRSRISIKGIRPEVIARTEGNSHNRFCFRLACQRVVREKHNLRSFYTPQVVDAKWYVRQDLNL